MIVSKDSFQQLIDFASYPSENPLVSGEKLFLPLVCERIKPGATASFSPVDRHVIESHLNALNLQYKIKRRPQLDDWYVLYSREKDYIESVEPDQEDESFGRFLGVPEEDNGWYYREDSPDISEVTPIPVHLGLDRSDIHGLEYARIVPWISKPTEDGLKRAIHTGRKWYDFAERLDREHGYFGAMEYCQFRMEHAGNWYRFDSEL